jgi:TPR repeat protein
VEDKLDMLTKAHNQKIDKGTALLASWRLNGDARVKSTYRAIQLFNELSSRGRDELISNNDMYAIGIAYHLGSYRIAIDHHLAVEWYKKAARRGHYSAQLIVADSYMFGKLGLPVELAKAKEFYYLSAKTIHYSSMVALGKIVRFEEDIGNVHEKRIWYNLALRKTKNGFPELQLYKLYRAIGLDPIAIRYLMLSVKKRNSEAMDLLWSTH